MPFTFSHTAAVAPLLGAKTRLSQTGLVIGSLVPDLEFYFKLRLDQTIGHTPAGVLLFDLPVAFCLVYMVHGLLKVPVFLASPGWVKNRIGVSFLGAFERTRTSIPWMICSIGIGIFSHLLLDGMTHHDGFLLAYFPFLEAKIPGFSLSIYAFLQGFLSVLGLLVLLLMAIRLPVLGDYSSWRSRFPFWQIVALGCVVALGFRLYFYPEVICFWDGYMTLMGGCFYGILLASLLFRGFFFWNGRGDREFHKLVNAGVLNPGFKFRSFFIQQDQFFPKFRKRIVQVDEFIDKSQLHTGNLTDVQVHGLKLTRKDFLPLGAQDIRIFPISFSGQLHDQGRIFKSCRHKTVYLYFHISLLLGKYINTQRIFLAFLLVIFCLSTLSYAQVAPQVTNNEGLREEFIQKASALRSKGDYSGAIAQLDQWLAVDSLDAPMLLFKGDLCLQNKEFAQAAAVYERLIPLGYQQTIARINRSYALFSDRKTKKALQVAAEAWVQDSLHQGAIVNYFNAMLWNTRTQEARQFLTKNQTRLKPDQVLVMQGRLSMNLGDFRTGLLVYDSLVGNFPEPAYIQEYAEVLSSRKKWKKVGQLLTLEGDPLTPPQKKRIKALLDQASLQTIGVQGGYFEDIAGNVRWEQGIFWENEQRMALQMGFRAGRSEVSSQEGVKTNATYVAGSLGYRWGQVWETKGELVYQRITPLNNISLQGFTGKGEVKFQPNDRIMAGLTYQSEILNFTAELLGENIRSQDVGYTTHLMLGGKTGFYSQGSLGTLSDGNSRKQVFASIYRLLRTEPTLKTGLNFSALGFSSTAVDDYFAPERFLSSEAFIEYSSPLPFSSKFSFQTQLAGGIQRIESLPWDPTFRGSLDLFYRINGLEFALRGQFSNVASSSGTGYQFHYLTFKLSKKF